jgi:hypothetical protein
VISNCLYVSINFTLVENTKGEMVKWKYSKDMTKETITKKD